MSVVAFGLAALLAGGGNLHGLAVTNGSRPFAGDDARRARDVQPGDIQHAALAGEGVLHIDDDKRGP